MTASALVNASLRWMPEMNPMRSALVILISSLAVTPVFAQRETTEAERTGAERLSSAAIQQPEARTPMTVGKPQLTLTAEKGKQVVTGTVGVAYGTTSYDLVFSGPIGEDDEVASPLTLDGLANGASVRFGITSGSAVKRRLTAADIQAITDFCTEINMPNDCDTTDMDPWDRAKYLRLFMPKVPVFWGAHAKVNRAKFTYSLDDGLTDTSDFHTGVGGTFSLGLLLPNLWFVAGHIEIQKAHKAAANPLQLCVPRGPAGVTSCRTTRLGEPTESTTRILTLEGRRVFVGRNVAINPNAAFDLDEKVSLYEIPVYFLREELAAMNPLPSLNGGISFGYHSENGLAIRAFVGVSFSLIQLK